MALGGEFLFLARGDDNGNIIDVTGNNVITNSGVTVGDADSGPFEGSRAMFFNGSSFFSIPDSYIWAFGSDGIAEFTISFFLKIPSVTIYGGLFYQHESSSTRGGIFILNNTIYYHYPFVGNDISTPLGLIADNYCHIGIIYKDNKLSRYKDGIALTVDTPCNVVTDINSDCIIGRWFNTLSSSFYPVQCQK